MTAEPTPWYDGWLHPLASLVSGLTDVFTDLHDENVGVDMTLVRLHVDLPLELTVEGTDVGGVLLAGAPPTQHVATTVMPVLHRLRLTATAHPVTDEATALS